MHVNFLDTNAETIAGEEPRKIQSKYQLTACDPASRRREGYGHVTCSLVLFITAP
jgi:hypothetical protein